MAWTTPITWAASVYTASDLNAQIRDNQRYLRFITAKMTEDVIVNTSIALNDLPGLAFFGQAAEVWAFVGTIYYVTNAAADAAWTVTVPVGSTGIFGIASNGVPTSGWSTTFGTKLALTVSGTIEEVMNIVGVITFGNVKGNAQVQATQGTSTGVATTFYDESFLTVWRLS